MAKEHETSNEQLKSAQKIVDEYKSKLKSKDKLLEGQSQQLEKLLESRDAEKDMVSEKDYEELKKKFSSSTKDLTQVKHKLKETEVRCEELSSENENYKGQLNSSQSGSDAEVTKLQEKLAETQTSLVLQKGGLSGLRHVGDREDLMTKKTARLLSLPLILPLLTKSKG